MPTPYNPKAVEIFEDIMRALRRVDLELNPKERKSFARLLDSLYQHVAVEEQEGMPGSLQISTLWDVDLLHGLRIFLDNEYEFKHFPLN